MAGMSGEEPEFNGDDQVPVAYIPDRHENPWVVSLKYLAKWLLLVVVGLTLPLVCLILFQLLGDILRPASYHYAKTIQNAKQVGYALFSFENDFGSYPNDETIKDLDEDAILSSAGGSNYYFSQLIAGGYVDQESPFFVDGVSIEPDNLKSPSAELLKQGEVGFAYVLWGSDMNSGNLRADAPLVIAYLQKNKKTKTRKIFERRAKYRIVVLKMDMSVSEYLAKRDGTVMLNGKDYFDWSQPHWGGQKPKIVWPE